MGLSPFLSPAPEICQQVQKVGVKKLRAPSPGGDVQGSSEAVPRIGGQDRDRLGSRQTEPNCQKLERLEKPSETRCGRRERYVPLVSYLRKVSNLTKKLYMDICFTAVIYSLWINYVCVDIYIPKCIFLHTLCVCALT